MNSIASIYELTTMRHKGQLAQFGFSFFTFRLSERICKRKGEGYRNII